MLKERDMAVLTSAQHLSLVRATGAEKDQLERDLSARQSDSVDYIIEKTNFSPLFKCYQGGKGDSIQRREIVLRVLDGVAAVRSYLAGKRLAEAEAVAFGRVSLRVTATQKAEWLACESGSYEDCLLRREQGASVEDTPHVSEVLMQGKRTEILVSSPVDMMLLVKSLSSNQFREIKPAMFERLWLNLLDQAKKYPLAADDAAQLSRIEHESMRWA